jgi:hypothetical protein
MFNWKRSRDIEDFAVRLARDFAGRVPPHESQEPKTAKLAGAIDDACNRAAAYQREHRLGIYGKAKFGTCFKLELAQIGYPEEFIETFTRQMLLTMSGK